jgi:hypothetical protein
LLRHIIPDSRVAHIFRDAEGHMPDTPENRALLVEVADDPTTMLGMDGLGNVWSARLQSDGSQLWTQTRGDQIVNGGLNRRPRSFDLRTGMSGAHRRGEQVSRQKDLIAAEAFQAMAAFLERYWERGRSDELASLLGALAIQPDGRPADPALAKDWAACVHKVVSQRER